MKKLQENALRALAVGIALLGVGSGLGWSQESQSTPGVKGKYTLGGPMRLLDEGSFFVGGEKKHTDYPSPTPVDLNAPGTYLVNQMYVHYWIPDTPKKKLPIIMVHGSNHTGMTYETTPDGREGWATWFVRQGYPVYVVDQAGRGRSGFDPSAINEAVAKGDASLLPTAGFQRYAWEGAWVNFLFGPEYPRAFEGLRFPVDHLKQYTAQLVPNTEVTLTGGTLNTINDLALLLDKIGPAVMIVHSQSGVMGLGAIVQRSKLVKGLISVEGGCEPIAPEDVKKAYSKVPFLSFWGDYSKGAPGANGDARRLGCKNTVAAFQEAGGDAQFLLLPKRGIKGNSHMMMMDDNNLELAEILRKWIVNHAGN